MINHHKNQSRKRRAKMTELLTMTSAAVSTIGSMLRLSNDIKNADLQRQIAELNIQIARIQNEAASLIKENGDLKEELDKYKNEKKDPLVYNSEDGLYYDKENDGPFCTRCYDKNRERIRVIKDSKRCPECNAYFGYNGPVVGVAKIIY
jgi:regulator of replication initiation timing